MSKRRLPISHWMDGFERTSHGLMLKLKCFVDDVMFWSLIVIMRTLFEYNRAIVIGDGQTKRRKGEGRENGPLIIYLGFQ